MGKRDDKPKEPRDLRRQAREVADSLAIAFILAMVIRHYVLEVFKIPTKSMEPTLLGDPWSGDKILVNKFAYDFRSPRRWEVAVFKYPKDTTKNYIKRAIGLPGETVRVMHGDVYINGAIAPKPWGVQQDLWRLTPHSLEPEAWAFAGPDGTRRPPSGLEFTADCTGGGNAELGYDRTILAYETDKIGGLFTSDIMVEFTLIPREAAGFVGVEITLTPPLNREEVLDRWEARFPLSGPECVPEVWRGPATSATLFAAGTRCRLPKDKAARIQVCNVDQSIIVRVNGTEVIAKDYELPPRVFESRAYTRQAWVRLRWSHAHATVRDPAVYVDVHYTSDDVRADGRDVSFGDYRNRPDVAAWGVKAPYQLKEDEYFVLGDNSANSNDSRAWQTVPRSYLVGEAFMVLWPLGRMKPVR
jgi:signal peptidase I